MKTLLAVLGLTALTAISSPRTAERIFHQGTNTYLLSFQFDDSWGSVPAINGPTQMHYGAVCTIYTIGNGKSVKVGEPVRCEYTEKGCFEDEPSMLIGKALEKPKP
jgi:hypothetical protein